MAGGRRPSSLWVGISQGLSFLGNPAFFLLVLPAGYWAADRGRFRALTLRVLVSAWLNTTIKGCFQVPRPRTQALVEVPGWSFPSAHAQIAACIWPHLARQTGRPWALALAASMVLGISTSRVYLGVHRPRDVVAGILLGLAVEETERRLAGPPEVWARLSPPRRAALILAMVPLWLATLPGGAGKDAGAVGGFLAGFWAGDLLRQDDPQADTAPWPMVALGLAGVVALRYGLKPPLAAVKGAPAWKMALRAAAVGGWITWAGPGLFRRLRRRFGRATRGNAPGLPTGSAGPAV